MVAMRRPWVDIFGNRVLLNLLNIDVSERNFLSLAISCLNRHWVRG